MLGGQYMRDCRNFIPLCFYPLRRKSRMNNLADGVCRTHSTWCCCATSSFWYKKTRGNNCENNSHGTSCTVNKSLHASQFQFLAPHTQIITDISHAKTFVFTALLSPWRPPLWSSSPEVKLHLTNLPKKTITF